MSVPSWLTAESRGVGIAVHLVPRAARNEVAGTRQGSLLVRVTAPPVEGRANEALRTVLAKRLGVARSRVEVVAGQRSRTKAVRVAGLTAAQALERLR